MVFLRDETHEGTGVVREDVTEEGAASAVVASDMSMESSILASFTGRESGDEGGSWSATGMDEGYRVENPGLDLCAGPERFEPSTGVQWNFGTAIAVNVAGCWDVGVTRSGAVLLRTSENRRVASLQEDRPLM